MKLWDTELKLHHDIVIRTIGKYFWQCLVGDKANLLILPYLLYHPCLSWTMAKAAFSHGRTEFSNVTYAL